MKNFLRKVFGRSGREQNVAPAEAPIDPVQLLRDELAALRHEDVEALRAAVSALRDEEVAPLRAALAALRNGEIPVLRQQQGSLETQMPVITARIDALSAQVGQLTEGLAELRKLSLPSETERAEEEALSAALRSLADLSTAWSENYTKPVDERYVAENQLNHDAMFRMVESLAGRVALGRPARLLEVGMGLGTMCIAFSRRSFEVFGIDQDALQVARAKLLCEQLGGFARFFCLDAFDLGLFQRNCFDVAFSQGTMEHFGPTDFRKVLALQLRVAPYVVFSVPSLDWPHAEIGDERRMSCEEWRAEIESAGFEAISVEYYGDARWHVLAAAGRRPERDDGQSAEGEE